MSMTHDDDIIKMLQVEINKSVDHQIIVDIMVRTSHWHAVQINGPPYDEEIQEWVNNNFKYRNMGRDGLWAFENRDEYIEFILRFVND